MGKERGKFVTLTLTLTLTLNFERKARVSVPQRDQQYQKLKSPPVRDVLGVGGHGDMPLSRHGIG